MHKNMFSSFRYRLMVVVLVVGYSCTSSKNKQVQLNESFNPGQHWLDNDSIHINAHGGGILFHQGKYYWFGEHKTTGRGGNTSLLGIRCYSSSDLYNWDNEGIALVSVDDPDSDITKGCVMERPKVIYNESTKRFVMWFHLELKGQGYRAARTAVATSENIAGPYRFLQSYRPNQQKYPIEFSDEMKSKVFNADYEWWTPEWRKQVDEGLFVSRDFEKGQMARDMTLFVDTDGKAYHIHSSEENLTLHISELNETYTGFTGKWTRVFPGGHNEAPAIFKRDSTYYMITSGCTGWKPNAARSAKASSILGPWIPLGNPCIGEDADLTFHSQSTFVLPVQGKENAFVYMGDRWKPRDPIDGRYVWLPIYFEEDRIILKWMDNWDLSVFDN